MPLIVPSAVPLVVASPPALVAPGVPSVLPAPYVLRHPALSARAIEELAEGVRRERRDWHPAPWWERARWPDPPPIMELDSNDKVFLTADDDLSDLNGRPGLNFIVVAGSLTGKTIALTGAGTQARPVVLRGASDGPDPSAFPEIVAGAGSLFTSASTRCVLYRFRLRNCHFSPTNYAYCRVARCQFYGNLFGGGGYALNLSGGNHFRFDRCQYGSTPTYPTSMGLLSAGQDMRNAEVCYNHFLNFQSVAAAIGGSIACLYFPNLGQVPRVYGTDFSFWAHHDLVSGTSGPVAINYYEGKITDAVVADSTVRYDLAGGPGVNIRARHGLRFRFLRNLFVYDGGGRGGGDIQARDVDGQVGENASLNSAGWSVNTAGGSQVTLFAGNLDADRWLTDRTPLTEDNWESCKRALCGGNAMPVTVGVPSPLTANHPKAYPADACIVPPDTRADGNSVVSFGNASNTDRATALNFRLASARAMRPLGPTDVGVALP